jgi:hypothetical protein
LAWQAEMPLYPGGTPHSGRGGEARHYEVQNLSGH